jgi:hypothetical protein
MRSLHRLEIFGSRSEKPVGSIALRLSGGSSSLEAGPGGPGNPKPRNHNST